MKIVDFISLFFILIVVLVVGRVWLTWEGSKVADEHGNYDLRKDRVKDDFSKAYESRDSHHKIEYKPTFEHTVKETKE